MKELSKHISTFAFCYACIYCFVEGLDAFSSGRPIWSFVCFLFAFFAFLAIFRFQIERLFYKLKDKGGAQKP